MTAQVPERIFIEGKPHWLFAQPLYRLLASRRTHIEAPDGWSTACHRRYVGSWEIANDRLWLVELSTFGCEELPLPDAMRNWFLRLVPANNFPVPAVWFTGCLRIPIGPKLIQGFHGWSSWFTRERVITCRQGKVVRDREVDTLAILEWALRRKEGLKMNLDPDDTPGGPLAWITEDDYSHLHGDWWPPQWSKDGRVNNSWFVSGLFAKRQ